MLSPLFCWLRQKFLDDLTSELGELFVATGVEVGKLVVVEAHEVEEGAVEVANGVDAVDGLGTNGIGRTNDAGLHAATGHEHGHGVGIMAAADGVNTAASVVVGRAAEFAAPDDESVVEHAALFEIADQGGHGFVYSGDA